MAPTFKLNVQTAELQLDALQRLAQRLMVMADAFFRARTEWQRKVTVRFLAIVIRADRVHPQHHFGRVFILVGAMWCSFN